MAAVAWVDEAEVAAAAVARDAAHALLPGRAMCIVHSEGALPILLLEGRLVQLQDLLPGHWAGKPSLRLRELAAHDLHLDALGKNAGQITFQEVVDCPVELRVGPARLQVSDPEPVGGLRGHCTGPVRWDSALMSLRHGVQAAAQGGLQLQAWLCSLRKANQEEGEDLGWFRDYVIAHRRYPDVIALGGPCRPEQQAAHQHVVTTPAISTADLGVLCKVLACTISLAAPTARVETVRHDA
mmetsp:Transcript_73574/g.215848  ORF Transcript_73574/g.215848 Transcript_73574/m.215848 type:complete len:240 (-) Transcript_73574:3270-3989(-)